MANFTRRQLLQSGLAAAAGLFLPPSWKRTQARAQAITLVAPEGLTKYIDQLPIPPVWTGGQLAARGLTMAESAHQFHSELGATPTWGYGGASYLGPTINIVSRQPVTYTARNRLGRHPLGVDTALHGPHMANDQERPRVSVHFHGGYTEPGSDGYPEDTFTPGENHPYYYANDQQAGTTWYHDHALGITRLNVYAGLAGFYLIRDSSIEGGLPPGPFEVPLAIQDKSFLAPGDGTNPLFYPDPWTPEFFGDIPVVNGKAWPNLNVARGRYRFRLLNGSSSRFYNLHLTPPVPLHLIGTDSGFVSAPVPLTHIILAPGERADVVVDFSGRSAGDRIRLMNAPLPDEVVSPADIEIRDIMQFTVQQRAGFRGPLPRTLREVVPLDPRAVIRKRNLLLVEIIDPDSDEPVMALLNNRRWDTHDVEQPVVHTLEQWNLINLTEDTHPIHLHLAQFQLLNRQLIDAEQYLADVFGVAELSPDKVGEGAWPFPSANSYVTGKPTEPQLYENGWKDTVQAHPGMVTRILVPFGSGAAAGVPFGQRYAFTGEYVWHCHILDHEDHEMMLPYEVVPSSVSRT